MITEVLSFVNFVQVKYKGYGKFAFLTNISQFSVYFENDTRYGDKYNGR